MEITGRVVSLSSYWAGQGIIPNKAMPKFTFESDDIPRLTGDSRSNTAGLPNDFAQANKLKAGDQIIVNIEKTSNSCRVTKLHRRLH